MRAQRDEVARELAFMKQLSNVSEHTGEPFPGCSSVLTLYHNPDGDNHDGGQGDAVIFAALVRRSERLRNLPIIVLTAKDLSRAELDFLAGRGATVLSKGPESRESLIAALAKPRGERS